MTRTRAARLWIDTDAVVGFECVCAVGNNDVITADGVVVVDATAFRVVVGRVRENIYTFGDDNLQKKKMVFETHAR